MPHLIDVENAFWYLVGLTQHDTISLKTNVVSDNRLLLEHFLCLNIRWLVRDHPGRSKLGGVANINLLAFLDRHFSAQGYWIHCEPTIDSANHGNWKSIFFLLLRRGISRQGYYWFARHSIKCRNSHIVWSAILIKLVTVNRHWALFGVSCVWNWCRCLFVDIECSNWWNVWLEKYLGTRKEFVLILGNIVVSFTDPKARGVLKCGLFFKSWKWPWRYHVCFRYTISQLLEILFSHISSRRRKASFILRFINRLFAIENMNRM